MNVLTTVEQKGLAEFKALYAKLSPQAQAEYAKAASFAARHIGKAVGITAAVSIVIGAVIGHHL